MSHPTSLPYVTYTWPLASTTNALVIVARPCPEPSTKVSLETHNKFPCLYNGLIFLIHSHVRGGAWRRKHKVHQQTKIWSWATKGARHEETGLSNGSTVTLLWLWRSYCSAILQKVSDYFAVDILQHPRRCESATHAILQIVQYRHVIAPICTCNVPELCSCVYNDLSTYKWCHLMPSNYFFFITTKASNNKNP
jgi:hypothetical protein